MTPDTGAADAAASTIDAENPWLGLASFPEETRAYFHGRDDEVAELARRVQRKLLTVLFGQSGLGKTSILRAGLAPRLRSQGYCPVYVRIDYGREAPEPAEQIKQAIARSARRAGQWSQAGVAVAGESLWEFLHHRDDVLQDESGATLIPLLIFDQFEEIFTLAQSDDFGRARAARFVEDLADLVENRPPRALEARLEADESAAERFDFARGDYRVLIALREDYLAPLEGLKSAMPSITQNRLRLAPMTGRQALAAVLQPGRGLVSEEVAAAIVRFVAGGAEIANAEVEPSLLSLICRELNDTRIAQGRGEISLDLLAGSHATILSNFYERSLADQPPAVRRVIEDELLTASGFRENVAEERVLVSFRAAGAAPDTLAVLVNRRLLRIEERLDVRRVELTHDVLCGVVKASRDLRQEREARDATERLLAEQRTRELAARAALVRARQIAVGCIALAACAVAAAIFAYFSTQRARQAERVAQQTRAQAEQLLGYLADDFAIELESFGRLDTVAELARRQIAYFDALPPAMRSATSTRNAALAMVQYAKANRYLGRMDLADAASARTVQLMETLRVRDPSEDSAATTIALGQAYAVRSRILQNKQDPGALPMAERAAALLKPAAEAEGATLVARRAYIETLDVLGLMQSRAQQQETALTTFRRAKEIAARSGARVLQPIDMAVWYAESVAWEASTLAELGRGDEVRVTAPDGNDLVARVLEVRPSYALALHAAELLDTVAVDVAVNDMRPNDAFEPGRRADRTSRMLLKLQPNNTVTYNNMAANLEHVGDANWAAGNIRDSLENYRAALVATDQANQGGANFIMNALYTTAVMAVRQADVGDAAAAAASIATAARAVAHLHEISPATSAIPAFGECLLEYGQAWVAVRQGDAATGRRYLQQSLGFMQGIKPQGGTEESYQHNCIYFGEGELGQDEYLLGRYADAERALREALEVRAKWPLSNDGERRDQAEVTTYLAMALARQGRVDEALEVIAPVVAFHRALAARNHGDQWQHVELAAALYAESLADNRRAPALLREATALIDAVPAEMRALSSVRLWQARIRTGAA